MHAFFRASRPRLARFPFAVPAVFCLVLAACAPETGRQDDPVVPPAGAGTAAERAPAAEAPWWSVLPRPGWAPFERVEVREDQDWFEVHRIDAGTFALLEPGQWQEVVSWLIIGERMALLFDTGLGIGDPAPLVAALTDRPVVVLNSHTHPDHIGSNARFTTIWGTALPWAVERRAGRSHEESVAFLLADDAVWMDLPEGFDPDTVRVDPFTVSRTVTDGELIDLGGRRLEVLFTPGHSPDSLSLLDLDRRILFSGDTFYPAPLYAHLPGSDFDAYRASAARLGALAERVDLVASGHNEPVQGGAILAEMHAAFEAVATGTAPFTVTDGVRRHDFGSFQILTRPPAAAAGSDPS